MSPSIRIRIAAAFAVVVAAAGVAALPALAAPKTAHAPSTAMGQLEVGVLAQINQLRATHHLKPLRLNASLSAAAEQHSAQMAADGYFAHNSADGSAFWKRIQGFYRSSPFGYWSVGENLLWSSPDVSPEQALNLWWNSPEHRANMLAPRWREIGIAAVHASAAPGVYQNMDVTIVTTDFGVRR